MTPKALTGSGKFHYFFKNHPQVKKGATKIRGLSIDTPSQIVAPPSRHKSGREYQWLAPPDRYALADAPEWLIEWITGKDDSTKFEVEDDRDLADHPGVGEDERHATLCRLVGRHLAKHGDTPDLLKLATAWGKRCDPPYPETKIEKVVANLVAKHLTNNPQEEDEDLDLTLRRFAEIEAKPSRGRR